MSRFRFVLIHLGLMLTSLLGYMEWGNGQHTFLFQVEADILGKMFTDPGSVLHPLIQLPLLGQLLLLTAMSLPRPPRWLSLAGIAGMGLLFLFILLAGILAANALMICSTLPFLSLGSFSLFQLYKTANPTT